MTNPHTPSPALPAPVAIIGGGITGLTTALVMNKLGLDCTVYEQAPEIKAVGAGIWMAPNAMQIFDALEIGDAVRKEGTTLQQVEITNKALSPYRRSIPDYVSGGTGTAITSIHRARLQQVLASALKPDQLKTGHEYVSHTPVITNDDDQAVYQTHAITFRKQRAEAALILGADGIHSKVREQLFPNHPLRYSGQTCWRGVAKMEIPKPLVATCKEAWGRNTRFGMSMIREDEIYWFAVTKSPRGQQDDPSTLKASLLHLFRNFSDTVTDIIHQTPLENIIRNDLTDLRRLKQWHQEGVCLLGDAAHATTPNMGQGGAQGVEDAWYISNLLAKASSPDAAFRQFELLRRKKVDSVVNNSWRLGKMAHSPVGQPLMRMIMRMVPEKAMARQLANLYSVKLDF